MSQRHAYGAVCSVCTCCDLVGALCPRYKFPLYAALYVWNMILKLLNVLGSCVCKMTPSVRALLVTFMYNTVEIWVILTEG